MGDPTESKVSSTENGSVKSKDMENAEQGPDNVPSGGDTAASPRDASTENAAASTGDAVVLSADAFPTPENKLQEGAVGMQQPVEVAVAAPNLEPMLPDYEEVCGDEDVWAAIRKGKTSFRLVKIADHLPVRGEPLKVNNPENKSNLSDLEGKQAKVFVDNCGKVGIVVGNNVFEIHTNVESCPKHELISIVHDEETNKDNLMLMGPVPHKIIIEPDWETLCKQIDKNFRRS